MHKKPLPAGDGKKSTGYSLDGLLTIEQLADKLAVSVRTVRDWIARRKIPFTKFGRRVYIDVGAIEACLRRSAVEPLAGMPGPTLVEQGGAPNKEGVLG